MFSSYRWILIQAQGVRTYWSYGDEAFLAEIEDFEFQSGFEHDYIYRSIYVAAPDPKLAGTVKQIYIQGVSSGSISRSIRIVGFTPPYREIYIAGVNVQYGDKREVYIFGAGSEVWTYWSYGDEAFLGDIEDFEFQSPFENEYTYRELYLNVNTPKLAGEKRFLYTYGQEIYSTRRSVYIAGRFFASRFIYTIGKEIISRHIYIAGNAKPQNYWWYGSEDFLGQPDDLEFQAGETGEQYRLVYIQGADILSNPASRHVYINGLSRASTYREIASHGKEFASISRTLYINGLERSSVKGLIYIPGSEVFSRSRNVYIQGLERASVYRAIVISPQEIFSTYRGIYHYGADILSNPNTRSVYIQGSERDSKSRTIYLNTNEIFSVNRSVYIRGLETSNQYREIYLAALSRASEFRAIYINAAETYSVSRNVYTSGRELNSVSRLLYVVGSERDRKHREVYLKTQEIFNTYRSVFVNASLLSSISRSIYIRGFSPQAATREFYIKGVETSSRSRYVYIRGVFYQYREIYIEGAAQGLKGGGIIRPRNYIYKHRTTGRIVKAPFDT